MVPHKSSRHKHHKHGKHRKHKNRSSSPAGRFVAEKNTSKEAVYVQFVSQ